MQKIPQRLLLGPGPSSVPQRVLSALSKPTIGHLDPVFLALMDELRGKLRQVFRTENELTLAVSGTGSAGMEAVMVNLLEPNDEVVVGIAGVFGNRMVDVAERCGARVHRVDAEWGRIVPPSEMCEAIERVKPKLAAIVHAETSTGVHQPLDGIAEAVHRHGGLFALDCVTSLAGMPVEIDAWGVDAAYSGTQKCLSCPPGLAPVTFSPRAEEAIDARRSKVASWYLDLTMVRNYWGAERSYHHTAPINMLYALDEALSIALEEGLEARFARHRQVHELLASQLAELGIEFVSQEGHRLSMLNAVGVPEGVDDAATRRRLLEEHDIEVGGGLGKFKGAAWRIGLMGDSAREDSVHRVVTSLKASLGR